MSTTTHQPNEKMSYGTLPPPQEPDSKQEYYQIHLGYSPDTEQDAATNDVPYYLSLCKRLLSIFFTFFFVQMGFCISQLADGEAPRPSGDIMIVAFVYWVLSELLVWVQWIHRVDRKTRREVKVWEV
ncbi:hypothetical protein QBC40DRAFT_298314 [Triangularia verruculosa]|uniref:Uncharacterized protein n=1 Tax=Triangularia verruculosa TaxID=2587418 RepID=A0AAN6XEG4_9PEZI|nr:hypothetical protein QBC40DRAFT_298314 [Triangularia verruculosa]